MPGLRRGSPGTLGVASSFLWLSTANRKRHVSGGWRLAAAGGGGGSRRLTSVFRGMSSRVGCTTGAEVPGVLLNCQAISVSVQG